MILKQLNFVGLILLSFSGVAQRNDTFAKEATQYQLYRLSDDPSDDRRPKLAINNEGTVWVIWESNRDGDFDIYGKRYANGDWSDFIEVAQDTNATFICDALFNRENRFFIFGTEVDLKKEVAPEFFFEKSQLFFLSFFEDSAMSKHVLANRIHHVAPYWYKHQLYPDDRPKAISFDQNIFTCYHREFHLNSAYSYDSLFIQLYEKETWQAEQCDSIFEQYDAGIMRDHFYSFPQFSINLFDKGLFVIVDAEDWHGGGPLIKDIGLVLSKDHLSRYILLTFYLQDYDGNRLGFQSYSYGSNLKTIFIAGFSYKERYSLEPTHLIKQIELINDTTAIDKREWQFDFKDNIKISQTSDLVAFVWSDSANIYIKTFQDSIWYETLQMPLNGLTHIDHSLNCAVYNNQQICITFDAIYNGNKDVYVLSVPASFVVDTVMTSVKQKVGNNTSPNDFALFQNYPNPFNSSTTIKYQLPEATEIKLEIYNLRGQRIRTLVDQFQIPGSYLIIWDGTDDFNQPVASGVYLYQLQTKYFARTNKLILIR
jgi:hypothetical protein